MPKVNTKAHVLVRNGFACRYFGTRLCLAQAIKVQDLHKPGRKYWDVHWESEPLKSHGATLDHIIPEVKDSHSKELQKSRYTTMLN